MCLIFVIHSYKPLLQTSHAGLTFTFMWMVFVFVFQLGAIEQEFLSLIKLEHPNIVHYLAIKHIPGKEAVTVEVR